MIDDDQTIIDVSGPGDPVRVSLRDDRYPWPIVLYFASVADDAALIGLEMGSSEEAGEALHLNDVQRVAANLSLYVGYSRAWFALDRGQVRRALRMLGDIGTTRRGLSGKFLRIVADEFNARVAAGESAPTKAIAAEHEVHKSTASRWISAARARGWIHDETQEEGRDHAR